MSTIQFIVCFILMAIGIGGVLTGIVNLICWTADKLWFNKKEAERKERETETARWLGEWGA